MDSYCGIGLIASSGLFRGVSNGISFKLDKDEIIMNDFITEDTKAICLLCSVFGKDRSVKPLSPKEYSSLFLWLKRMGMRPSDLLQKDNIDEASMGSNIDKQRLESLISRGVKLGLAIEEWQRNGIWIVSQSDNDYPNRYKNHLKEKAPPLLFGVGNRALLRGGGLGIVGSRNVDQAGADFTRQVAELCADNHMPVVSGGARGVDQISMNVALEAGGNTIGILANNLLKKSVERNARHAIAEGHLLLLSPYHPNAHFTVGAAMGRNKLIYAMSDYCLVVSAEHNKGGTWAGAKEELKRKNPLPVFVRIGNEVPQGNIKLQELGAIPWSDSVDSNNFKQKLQELANASRRNQTRENPELFDYTMDQESIHGEVLPPSTKIKDEMSSIAEPKSEVESKTKTTKNPNSIYQAVLPIILSELDSPMNANELAGILNVKKGQLHAWLKRAVGENKIIKLKNSVRYQKTE